MAKVIPPDQPSPQPPPPAQPKLVPPPPTRAQPPRRNWKRWGWLAAFVLVLVAALEFWRMHSAGAVTYETVAVTHGPVQVSVTASGTLNAVVDVQVGSQVSGNIKALYADFNTKVTKGQLVAEIDPQTFQTQVDQATAALAAVHSNVLIAGAQIQKTKSDIAGAMANEKGMEAASAKDKANQANAKSLFDRQNELSAKGLISKQDFEASKTALDSANAQVAAGQAQIDASKQTIQSAQEQSNVTQDQLAAAQAQERQSQASLAAAKLNLEHTRITAPVDGTVIARKMDVGQTVAASFSAPTIFEIAQDLTKMQLDTSVDESDIGTISEGQQATFTVDAYPGTTFHGEVNAVRKAPITQQNVVTYDVVVSVANPDLKLFPGMTANARIFTQKVDDTLKVPNAVLRVHPTAEMLTQLGLPATQPGRQQVLYVLRDGKLQEVPVKFGLSDGRDTAVTADGLKEGEPVVMRLNSGSSAPAAGAPAAAPGLPGAGGGGRGGGGGGGRRGPF